LPASESSPGGTRRGGSRRPSVGARGAVRVDPGFVTEYPGADPSSTEACATVVRAGEALVTEVGRCIDEVLGVRHPVLTALAVLDGAGEALTPSEIADRMLVASATMTATLDALERRGWVRRLPNPEDRRSTLVEITPEGRAASDTVLPAIRSVEKALMSVLTPTEREQLVEMLDRVLRHSAVVAAAAVAEPQGARVRPAPLAGTTGPAAATP
jgi:DNA-binding MarR family transcriptional regulator